MSAHPRHIPDSECKQGKCACSTTGCWGECNMKRFPLMYTTMSSAIGKSDLIPDGYEVGIRYQLQPVAATLPAAPAPTEQAGELPPLPEPFTDWRINRQSAFNADQMREYARAALAARRAPTPKASQ